MLSRVRFFTFKQKKCSDRPECEGFWRNAYAYEATFFQNVSSVRLCFRISPFKHIIQGNLETIAIGRTLHTPAHAAETLLFHLYNKY
ncbi:hypothetical protein A7K91_14000 [Paenibacillus oryzae]|uniref:Uncharacterized protein n=1 Tax=Paenibacillus oryzae TaxID=1844972 RepID=A0A1A5YJA9_9BACL|nr:hypothetical protein A7K91_14000 [Paenibacillus oryzae]